MASTNTFGNESQKRWVILVQVLLLFLIAVVVTWSIWQAPALVSGHSAWKDLARLVEFDAAIRAGEFFPAWSPDLWMGYGSPVFQFYAPLAYYATEVPVLMGFNYATALKVTWLLTLFGSGLAMYRLASAYLSAWAACVGSIFYMVAPYRLVDIFVRHALAEHSAFIWLPLIVWGTAQFAANLSRVGFLVGAVATAALILTHNVMALIGLPVCVAVAVVFAAATKHGRAKLVNMSLAVTGVPLVGAGLAAFFWLPAISGRSLTGAEKSLTTGYYDFHRHFVQGWQLIDTHWNFGVSGGGTEEQMPLQIGLLHLLAAVGALAMVLAGWQGKGEAGRKRFLWSVVGLCIVAVGAFMSCRWSEPAWQWVPLLKYVQFPWRFLGLVVFGSAMCATALADRGVDIVSRSSARRLQFDESSARGWFNYQGVVIVALIAVIMAVYFPYYSRVLFLTGDARSRSVARVSAAEMRAMQSSGVLIPFGLSVKPGELRQMNEEATSDDFLPRDVRQKPIKRPSHIVQANGGRVNDVAQLNHNHYRSELQMSAPGKAELLQFWFPGWHASVDGIPVETASAGPQAIVSCDVPAGDHIVEFSYSAWHQRSIGIIISIVSIAITACAVCFIWRRGVTAKR